jgi:sugar/nucleoside kinase (ribokinase family)
VLCIRTIQKNVVYLCPKVDVWSHTADLRVSKMQKSTDFAQDGKEFYQSKHYDINPIIDRVGGGDSFSGGLIHGLLTKATQGEALEFAVAASALKHTVPGDFNLVSVDEVESLAGGNANGRVQR